LDENPNLFRNPTVRPANSAELMHTIPSALLGVLVGGSNTFRLTKAFEKMGKPVESLEASGWAITIRYHHPLSPWDQSTVCC
jgi:surfactin synthase thioesterase subunit